MSRLEFGPDTDAIEVIDIETGRMVFAAVPAIPVALRELTLTIHSAGYEIARASLTARGVLRDDLRLWVPDAEQELRLAGAEERLRELRDIAPGASIVVAGTWSDDDGVQVIAVESFSIPQRS